MIYKSNAGWRLHINHGDPVDPTDLRPSISIITGDFGEEPPAYLLPMALIWAASIVDDKDTRADIDKLGVAVGIDTSGERLKADALKALRAHGG